MTPDSQSSYLFDTPIQAIGDPGGEPCQYESGGVIMFKLSIPCCLGNLVNALLLFAIDVIYEILLLLRTVLASFAKPPVFGLTVQTPIFQAATANILVSLCQIGGLIGSVFPVTFSCSAQTLAGAPPPPFFLPGGSIELLGSIPPVVPAVQRFTSVCTYDLQHWATPPGSACDCNTSTLYFNHTAPPSPQCFLECITPGESFPFLVGATALDRNLNMTAGVQTYFTSAAAIRTFLSACVVNETTGNNTFNGTIPLTGFNSVPVYNPQNISSYPAAGLVCQLIPAMLNWRYQSLYNPSTEILFSVSNNIGSSNCSKWSNITGFFSSINNLIPGIRVGEFIDFVNRWAYGGALAFPADPNQFWQSTVTQGNIYDVWELATELSLFATSAPLNWAQTMQTMIYGLTLYNQVC